MTIDQLIAELECERKEHGGDTVVSITTSKTGEVIHDENIFVIVEDFSDGKICQIRDFPY